MSDGDVSIWVKTGVDPITGSYFVEIELDDDHAIALSPTEALVYSNAVFTIAQQAEHDAAVFTQLRTLLKDDEAAMMSVVTLRMDRPPLDVKILKPFAIAPGVNAKGKPFLALSIDGEQCGQWDPSQARSHASYVLEAVHAADLDSAYYRMLIGAIGIDGNRARNVVSDLANHRWDGDHG